MADGSDIVVVTGGTFGIGRAITLDLAGAGYRVIAFGVEAKQPGSTAIGGIESTRQMIEQRGVSADVRELDVTDIDAIQGLAAEIEAMPGRLHGLVNCAAIRIPGPLGDVTIDAWRRTMDVNIGGMFYCCQAFVPQMADSERGASIVNVGSAAGWGRPALLAYGASKGAVFGFSQGLAYDLKSSRIRVNTVVPGGKVLSGMTEAMGMSENEWLATGDLSPAGRPVSPEDVAHAVAFLMSDEASQISGAVLNVGGMINQGGGSRAR